MTTARPQQLESAPFQNYSSTDRRECPRNSRPGTITIAARGAAMATAGLVEHTTQGARIVLDGEARVNQRLDFNLSTQNGRLEGYARVAWTVSTVNGKQVAGLEFIDFSIASRSLSE